MEFHHFYHFQAISPWQLNFFLLICCDFFSFWLFLKLFFSEGKWSIWACFGWLVITVIYLGNVMHLNWGWVGLLKQGGGRWVGIHLDALLITGHREWLLYWDNLSSKFTIPCTKLAYSTRHTQPKKAQQKSIQPKTTSKLYKLISDCSLHF